MRVPMHCGKIENNVALSHQINCPNDSAHTRLELRHPLASQPQRLDAWDAFYNTKKTTRTSTIRTATT